MMGRRRRGKQGKCIPHFLFVLGFFPCRIVCCFLPNHAEHPSKQRYRLAVFKSDLSYAENTKGVFLT